MQTAKQRREPKGRHRNSPELTSGIVIPCAGHEADERMQRLFVLVVRIATGDQETPIRSSQSLRRGEEGER